MKLVDLIRDNVVSFDSYRQGILYYNIKEYKGWDVPGVIWQFPVPIDDTGNATFLNEDKAINYMRWIRKGQEDGTLVKVGDFRLDSGHI